MRPGRHIVPGIIKIVRRQRPWRGRTTWLEFEPQQQRRLIFNAEAELVALITGLRAKDTFYPPHACISEQFADVVRPALLKVGE